MSLKIIENFDSSFILEPQSQETLFTLLTGEVFLSQVCQNLQWQKVEFTELLFQPVPYSLITPKGNASRI
jgi:hypothetical protein